MGGDAEDHFHLAQRFALHGAAGRLAAGADSQIGLAGHQCLPGAGEHFGAQAQSGRRASRRAFIAGQEIERLHQIEQRAAGEGVVHGDGQLALPAGGDAAHAVGHGVHFGQQTAAFNQQLLAGGGQHCLSRAAVEQQHVERVFQLSHAVSQRGRHFADLAGGGGKAAGSGDGVHHRQRVGGQNTAFFDGFVRDIHCFILFER